MKKSLITLLLFFIAGLLAAQENSAYTKGLVVQPSIVQFNAANNTEAVNRKIKIDNKTERTVQMRLYLADWERDINGKHIYYPELGSKPFSCSQWMTLEKSFIEVPAGGSSFVNISLKIPDTVAAINDMKWSMLFAEVVNEKKTIVDTIPRPAINQLYRFGIHIYQIPPSANKREMRLTEFERISEKKDSIIYGALVSNEGSTQLKIKTSLEITNLSDGNKTKLTPISVSVFPGKQRRVSFLIPPSLPKGNYNLLMALDGGEDLPIEAAEVKLEIK